MPENLIGPPPKKSRSRRTDLVIAVFVLALMVAGIIWGRSGKLRDLHGNRAETYFNGKEFGRAVEEYTEAIRHDPTCALAYANRGSAYFNKGEFEQAIGD